MLRTTPNMKSRGAIFNLGKLRTRSCEMTEAGFNKSDTGESSERLTSCEPVEVTLESPGQWSQLTLVHRDEWCQGKKTLFNPIEPAREVTGLDWINISNCVTCVSGVTFIQTGLNVHTFPQRIFYLCF